MSLHCLQLQSRTYLPESGALLCDLPTVSSREVIWRVAGGRRATIPAIAGAEKAPRVKDSQSAGQWRRRAGASELSVVQPVGHILDRRQRFGGVAP